VITVGAAVLRDGPGRAVLLTKRPDGTHLAGLWEFPGGRVEEGEDPEHTVVRECKEEIALDVRVIDILDVAYHRYREKDVLLLFYDCRVIGGSIAHLGVADHAWVEPSRLSEYELPPPDARLIAKLLAGR
jgi:8-oxo-dGTP diphosphatase